MMVGKRLVAVVCCYFVHSAFAADSGAKLLENMSEAMQSRSYSGTFIYRHKDNVETLKIIHRNQAGKIDERLITLSGKPREIIRSDSVVTCIWPENQLVMVDKSHPRSNFPGIMFEDLERVQQHYSLNVHAQTERVAGRDCTIVDVQPKDQFRYGYRLWIDRENHLLVRSDLLDANHQPIEQVMFTELSVHDSIQDQAFKSELMSDKFRRREIDETGKKTATTTTADSDWQVGQLPSGFVMQMHRQRVKKDSNVEIQHMVFSDGLASVSVFIEPGDMNKRLEGKRRRGGLNIYSKVVDGQNVTVVGEVPKQTVELIAGSVERKKE
jgi:sigma-E factor negative regulatory protein RseB